MSNSRRELWYFEPTKEWLASGNPKTKKEIISWYRKSKSSLERRLRGVITRRFSAFTVIVDKETKQPIKKSKKPTDYDLELWRLSEQDYLVYRQSLDKHFQELRDCHNRRVKAKKEKQQNGQ